jgi:hypothetical protein
MPTRAIDGFLNGTSTLPFHLPECSAGMRAHASRMAV